MLDYIIQHRELLKLIYGLLIVLICVIIVLRANKLFKLSFHQGIRYFRNAFFFYGIAFAIRYFLGSVLFYETNITGLPIIKFLFEYFIIMAGFFLLYSLIWKKLELKNSNPESSLFNKNLIVFYLMALVIGILDNLWDTYFLMFLSQIILFFLATIISYSNFRENGALHKFLKFYFIAMLLTLTAWLLSALLLLYLQWHVLVLIVVYIINFIIFLLFLFGVLNVTKKV